MRACRKLPPILSRLPLPHEKRTEPHPNTSQASARADKERENRLNAARQKSMQTPGAASTGSNSKVEATHDDDPDSGPTTDLRYVMPAPPKKIRVHLPPGITCVTSTQGHQRGSGIRTEGEWRWCASGPQQRRVQFCPWQRTNWGAPRRVAPSDGVLSQRHADDSGYGSYSDFPARRYLVAFGIGPRVDPGRRQDR